MSSFTFYIFFVFFLAFVLLAINLIFAPNNPYQEKNSAFECGFHSFLGQNRTQFTISFFVFALLFLLFDLEILLVYPYVVSAYSNGIYGLLIMLIFFLVLTLGFAFELGKKALNIDTRQSSSNKDKYTNLNAKFTIKTSLSSNNKKNYSTISSSKPVSFNLKKVFNRLLFLFFNRSFWYYINEIVVSMIYNIPLLKLAVSHCSTKIIQVIEQNLSDKLLSLMKTSKIVSNIINVINTFLP